MAMARVEGSEREVAGVKAWKPGGVTRVMEETKGGEEEEGKRRVAQ